MSVSSPLLREAAAELGDTMVAHRRTLHRSPELSGHEHKTAAYIAAQLKALGLAPRLLCGGRGVVADLPFTPATAATASAAASASASAAAAAPPPAVALRADTDALPVSEQTGLPFASQTSGVMHACGHDGHSSMLLGAAQLLLAGVRQGRPLAAPVRLLFQPAEETSEGARQMVAEGALAGVGLVLGGHLDRRYPCGGIVVQEGCVNASTDTLKIRLCGRAGHGARPHECVDAVVMMAALVMQLQAVVAREVPPACPAVVTVGRVQAGEAYNVVAGTASLEGTVRALDPGIRAQLHDAIRRVAQGVAQAHGGEASVAFERGVPPVINHAAALPLARAAAAAVVGAENIHALHGPNMGGEDFAIYLQHVPGVYVRYGAAIPGEPNISAHSATWDFNEATMLVGAAYLAQSARMAAAALAGGGDGGPDVDGDALRAAARQAVETMASGSHPEAAT